MGSVPWLCQAQADQHRARAPKPSTQGVVWLPNLMIPVPNYLRFSINLLDCTQELGTAFRLARAGKIEYITAGLESAKGREQRWSPLQEAGLRPWPALLVEWPLMTLDIFQNSVPAVAAGFSRSLWGLELALWCRACLRWSPARCLFQLHVSCGCVC